MAAAAPLLALFLLALCSLASGWVISTAFAQQATLTIDYPKDADFTQCMATSYALQQEKFCYVLDRACGDGNFPSLEVRNCSISQQYVVDVCASFSSACLTSVLKGSSTPPLSTRSSRAL